MQELGDINSDQAAINEEYQRHREDEEALRASAHLKDPKVVLTERVNVRVHLVFEFLHAFTVTPHGCRKLTWMSVVLQLSLRRDNIDVRQRELYRRTDKIKSLLSELGAAGRD